SSRSRAGSARPTKRCRGPRSRPACHARDESSPRTYNKRSKVQKNRLTWMIGGPQGSGINASAEVFAKACSRAGLRVYANIEYHSNIMGKHSFYRVRVDDEDVRLYKDKADILVALDLETLAGDGDHRRWATHYGHLAEINDGGGVIFDNEIGFDPATANRPDLRFYPVPFMEIIKKALEEVGKGEQARRYEVMKNTVGLGASLALCEYPFDLVAEVIRSQFKGKRAEIGELNVRAAKLAFEHVKQHESAKDFPYTLKPNREPRARILAKGYEIHAIAKLKAGCSFQTYYPISPATDESVFLERQPPGDLREAYQDTFSAFNWAERYQMPIIVLSDKKLASVYTTIDKLELKWDQIDRGERFTGSEWTAVDAKGANDAGTQAGHNGNGHGKMDLANVKEYLRYAFAKDGISPRSRPGIKGGRHWITSDEHDPDGHITEGVEMRVAMMEKRMG